MTTGLSSANPNWLVFHVSFSFCSRSSLPSEFDWAAKTASPPRIVPEPGLLCRKGKIQVEENRLLNLQNASRGGVAERESDSLNWPGIFG
jgi:hypothetical protein